MTHYIYGGDQPLSPAERLAMEHVKEESPKIRPAERMENMEFLINCGVALEGALLRSGFNSLDTFRRAAYRHGRHDLIKHATEQLAA